MKFEIGQIVTVINVQPLNGNTIAPPLKLNKEYSIISIIEDNAGNQHINVGLSSMYNYITSWETKEELIDGDTIHWCHPSRFVLK